jgi:hypothetical protein
MPADAEAARPLEALGRVLTCVEAVRNGPAWFALLLAFAAAGWLLACADLALTAHAPTAAAAWGGVSLTVLFYGTNTAGLLLMDQARGVAPRQARQALRDALAHSHRLLLVLLAVLLVAALGLALVAAALAATRVPVLGPALFGLLLPAAVLLVGLTVRATLSMLWRHVRQRLVFVALLMGAVSGLAALVGALASFAVVAGGRIVSMLAVLAAGIEVPPKLLMAGLFGHGLRSLGATPIPAGASPYVGAALVGGGLVFMLALALPALVYIRGTCSVYLALEGHGAPGRPD